MLGHMDREARGAVYTRVEVVEFILDLVGYTDDVDLTACRILEPSCGSEASSVPSARIISVKCLLGLKS